MSLGEREKLQAAGIDYNGDIVEARKDTIDPVRVKKPRSRKAKRKIVDASGREAIALVTEEVDNDGKWAPSDIKILATKEVGSETWDKVTSKEIRDYEKDRVLKGMAEKEAKQNDAALRKKLEDFNKEFGVVSEDDLDDRITGGYGITVNKEGGKLVIRAPPSNNAQAAIDDAEKYWLCIPKYVALPYHGSMLDLPDNVVLCDGSTYERPQDTPYTTPDYTGRVARGAVEGETQGDLGGNEILDLSHSHTLHNDVETEWTTETATIQNGSGSNIDVLVPRQGYPDIVGQSPDQSAISFAPAYVAAKIVMRIW